MFYTSDTSGFATERILRARYVEWTSTVPGRSLLIHSDHAGASGIGIKGSTDAAEWWRGGEGRLIRIIDVVTYAFNEEVPPLERVRLREVIESEDRITYDMVLQM